MNRIRSSTATLRSLSWICLMLLLGTFSCHKPGTYDEKGEERTTLSHTEINAEMDTKPIEKTDDFSAFIPDGFYIFDKIHGDLNKDGIDDHVIMIKGTDKEQIIEDEYHGKLDRNRRGIIILFKDKDNYQVAVKNLSCFSSENEDGGVYYAPELHLEIKKGNLYVNYAHGRYGYWTYTFRYQNSDLELIGYDASQNRGPVVNSEVSINFLTKKKIYKVNTNEDAESGEEVFEETVSKVNVQKLIRLSEIEDFDELRVEGE